MRVPQTGRPFWPRVNKYLGERTRKGEYAVHLPATHCMPYSTGDIDPLILQKLLAMNPTTQESCPSLAYLPGKSTYHIKHLLAWLKTNNILALSQVRFVTQAVARDSYNTAYTYKLHKSVLGINTKEKHWISATNQGRILHANTFFFTIFTISCKTSFSATCWCTWSPQFLISVSNTCNIPAVNQVTLVIIHYQNKEHSFIVPSVMRHQTWNLRCKTSKLMGSPLTAPVSKSDYQKFRSRVRARALTVRARSWICGFLFARRFLTAFTTSFDCLIQPTTRWFNQHTTDAEPQMALYVELPTVDQA